MDWAKPCRFWKVVFDRKFCVLIIKRDVWAGDKMGASNAHVFMRFSFYENHNLNMPAPMAGMLRFERLNLTPQKRHAFRYALLAESSSLGSFSPLIVDWLMIDFSGNGCWPGTINHVEIDC